MLAHHHARWLDFTDCTAAHPARVILRQDGHRLLGTARLLGSGVGLLDSRGTCLPPSFSSILMVPSVYGAHSTTSHDICNSIINISY